MKINTFIIGTQKAGTTSLYEWLIQHPNICGEQSLKEYPFFINEALYSQGGTYLESQFKCSNEFIRISGCVDYVEDVNSLKRIYEYNPNSKIILIIRKPEDRIVSAYNFLRQLGEETNDDINKALENDERYLQRSLYSKKIELLHQIFKPENVKIIIFERLVKDSQDVLNEVFDFLDVEMNEQIEIFNANKTGKTRFKAINKVLYDKESNKGIRALVKKIFSANTRVKIRRFIKKLNSKEIQQDRQTVVLNTVFLEKINEDKNKLNKIIDVETYW